jgi:hypothetical protein
MKFGKLLKDLCEGNPQMSEQPLIRCAGERVCWPLLLPHQKAAAGSIPAWSGLHHIPSAPSAAHINVQLGIAAHLRHPILQTAAAVRYGFGTDQPACLLASHVRRYKELKKHLKSIKKQQEQGEQQEQPAAAGEEAPDKAAAAAAQAQQQTRQDTGLQESSEEEDPGYPLGPELPADLSAEEQAFVTMLNEGTAAATNPCAAAETAAIESFIPGHSQSCMTRS